jgi:hypothetical protein
MLSALLVMAILSGLVLVFDRKGYISNLLSRAVDWMIAYKARLKTTLGVSGQRGFMDLDTAIDAVITIVLVMIIIYQFIPTIEDAADTSNITNTTVKTFGDLGGWLIPLLAVVGVIVLGVRVFIRKGKKE